MTALSRAGGVDYLHEQAIKNPTSFLQLLGKILPTQIDAGDDMPVLGVIMVPHKNEVQDFVQLVDAREPVTDGDEDED